MPSCCTLVTTPTPRACARLHFRALQMVFDVGRAPGRRDPNRRATRPSAAISVTRVRRQLRQPIRFVVELAGRTIASDCCESSSAMSCAWLTRRVSMTIALVRRRSRRDDDASGKASAARGDAERRQEDLRAEAEGHVTSFVQQACNRTVSR